MDADIVTHLLENQLTTLDSLETLVTNYCSNYKKSLMSQFSETDCFSIWARAIFTRRGAKKGVALIAAVVMARRLRPQNRNVAARIGPFIWTL
jgi:hypothetical protein